MAESSTRCPSRVTSALRKSTCTAPKRYAVADRRAGRRPMAQPGLHPGQELRHGEGLGEVVVRAQLQAHHAVHHLAAGREHEDGGRDAALPQVAAHVEAVAARAA